MLHLSRLTSLALTIALVIGAPLAFAAQPAPAVAPAGTAATSSPAAAGKCALCRAWTDQSLVRRAVDDKTLLETRSRACSATLIRTRPTSALKTSPSCRKAPAVSSAVWALKSAPKTALSKSSRLLMTRQRRRPAFRLATSSSRSTVSRLAARPCRSRGQQARQDRPEITALVGRWQANGGTHHT